MGRQRPAVPGPQRRDAAQRRPQRPDQPRLRQGPQRGQGDRRAAQHDAHPRSDRRGDLLARPRLRALEPRVPHARRRPPSRTADSARLFATTNLAAADAAIGCWNNKYHYNSWRPITAIREADTDGNPATTADPTWTPLFDPATPVAAGQAPLVTPPFPENPSGHNCAAGAILRTLRYFFGTNDVSFTATSNKSGTTRTFHRLSDALQENINARVWAGIHFRTADLQGVKLGATVARYLHQHYFQPVR